MNKNELGQIFTNKKVAEYMISLFRLSKQSRILDPCFGAGVFIEAAINAGYQHIDGYEIDQKLFDECQIKFPSNFLLNKDFLTANSKIKYDGIIMNPPYIRHEKIDSFMPLGLSKKILQRNKLFHMLSKKANMYMYFVIKAIDMLKQNGELIVIFPSSWLQTNDSKNFKEYINLQCNLLQQIHLSGEIFEKHVLVEVLILKLKKTKDNHRAKLEYVNIDNNVVQNLDDQKNENLNLGFNIKFDEIASIKRGLTTGYNTMYINPMLECEKSKKYLRSIISSPKSISMYSTENAKKDTILLLDGSEKLTKEIYDYLEKARNNIMNNKKPITLYNKIKNNKVWFALKSMKCQGILFSYFVRNDIKFIYNNADSLVRDNFYIIQPKIDNYIMFAFLNNYYTYYQLEKIGKKYGGGLLKLQRYDIENLFFPNQMHFSIKDIKELKKLAAELIEKGNKNLIDQITMIIEKYSKVNYYDIIKAYNAEKIFRLRQYE
jgi:adenine-specific DNA-methyltransferase